MISKLGTTKLLLLLGTAFVGGILLRLIVGSLF
jgi:hypothetical protein